MSPVSQTNMIGLDDGPDWADSTLFLQDARTMGRRRIAPFLAALAVVATLAAGCSADHATSARSSTTRTSTVRTSTTSTTSPPPADRSFSTPLSTPSLQPGSDPSVLPSPVLIADRTNNRLLVVNQQGEVVWEFPRPGDLAPGQTFLVPDDAFFTPDGREIVVTQEDDFVITIIDVATHRIVYRYGTPGQPGSGPNQVHNPDDAMQLPDGYLIAADIKNCRILLIAPGAHTPTQIFGETTNSCLHDPPTRWGSPNGAFPLSNGHYVVTEINGDWVDELGLAGTVYKSAHPPGINYPSDTNEVSPGVLVTVDYSNPGTLETFDWSGNLLWRYHPLLGDPQLNHPSLAFALPNGDFLMNDDFNDRVVVIDPRSDRIVWQYGNTGQTGTAAGYLNRPDGVDLVPPFSFDIVRAETMGQPTTPTP